MLQSNLFQMLNHFSLLPRHTQRKGSRERLPGSEDRLHGQPGGEAQLHAVHALVAKADQVSQRWFFSDPGARDDPKLLENHLSMSTSQS
jgi:hypothetical protein